MMHIEEALNVIFGNKIRSLLTVTGLIIGVMAVIAIQVLGSSMSGALNGALGNMTDDSFIIFPSATQANAVKASVTRTDLVQLSALPNVKLAIPLVAQTDLVRNGHLQARYFISGDPVEPFNNAPLQFGRRFTQEEIDAGRHVAVISDRAYKKLFPGGGDPVGQSMYVGSHRYLILGVLSTPKQGLIQTNFGGDVSAPYTTLLRDYVHGQRIGAARVIVKDSSSMSLTEVAVIKTLRDLRGNQRLEYNTFDKAQLTKGINSIFGVMTFVVAFIGAISLLVAGIGIMNILLVSVTERTREIGVRKAIGATRTQILLQFFIEALVLCGIGCGIGLVLGLAIGASVNSFAIVKLTGYAPPIPWIQAAVTTLVFTTAVTIGCGTVPAFRAATLDPIEALRYE
ncbi:MAG TPA: ABC transporter permease [Candidatus Baltobacteraceae bacterium]|jgi:ABC-type antimicrobial peptide transport system permease subunit|nr:ABC transporter permease [Candidatus Baltobacteraceae bacterium]